MAVTCLTAVGLMTSGMAFGTTLTTHLRTDKTVYLMDPYNWVYTASQFGVWPEEGYLRKVSFYVNIYDASGIPTEVADVGFEVYDEDVLLAEGSLSMPGPGSYEGSFELNEANLGADTFSGHVPKELSLEISAIGEGVIKTQTVYVGRWGCDRCHVDVNLGKELYPWSSPSGGPASPHSWGNVLGRRYNPAGFDIDYLTKSETSEGSGAERTHTPEGNLNVFPFHEKTKRKMPESDFCTPCHQGSGRVRHAYKDGVSRPWVSHAKAEAVECTFCHGIEGGHRPDEVDGSTWLDNAGYIYPFTSHGHNNVPLVPDTNRDPYLARQTCSNPGCHGHIEDNAPGEVLHNKPDCRNCHGIHNDKFK